MLASIRCTTLALALLLAPSLSAQGRLPNDSLALGRRWSEWFLNGHADSLASKMPADVLQAAGGVSGIMDAQAMVAERAGTMKLLMEEKFIWRNGRRQYWRTMAMTTLPEPFLLRFVMSEEGTIAGIGLGPLSAAPPIDSAPPPAKP